VNSISSLVSPGRGMVWLF